MCIICQLTLSKITNETFFGGFKLAKYLQNELLQAEELDDHKVQVTPPGFHVIFLPFADDFRKIKLEDAPRGMNHEIIFINHIAISISISYIC